MNLTALPETMTWRVYRGDTAEFTILVNDDAGDPQDLTGWTCTVSTANETGEVDGLEATVGDGEVTISITDYTALLTRNDFDVQFTRPDTSIWTAVRGTLLVLNEVVTT